MKDDFTTNSTVTTSLIHFSLKGLENILFENGSERVRQLAEYSGRLLGFKGI